jgi:ribosomal protein S18 acetylase RimI-like enzyme
MSHPLDNMVWEALGGPQFRLGATDGIVRHFDPTIAMFAAVADPRSADFATLPSGNSFGFVTAEAVPFPPHIEVQREAVVTQMIAEQPRLATPRDDLVALTDDHVPQMMELVELTKPGPFARRTNKMGKYWGIIESGQLVAMAGDRLRLAGFGEVSAVCTHPEHRGKGYARELISKVAQGVVARGETPFLQAYPDNVAAISLYESLGFTVRRSLTFTVVRRRD